MLERKITAPSLRAAISGSTRFESQSALLTLFFITVSNASLLSSLRGPRTGLAPTLFTRIFTLPKAACVRSISSWRCFAEPTLQATPIAFPPAARIAAATLSQASWWRLEITTAAPTLAIPSAIARPMPREEPVISAVFPVRSNKPLPFVILGMLGRIAPPPKGRSISPHCRARETVGKKNDRATVNGGYDRSRRPGDQAARYPGDQPGRRGSFHEPCLHSDAAAAVPLRARRIRRELRAARLRHGRFRLFLGDAPDADRLHRRPLRLEHPAHRRPRFERDRYRHCRPHSGLLGADPRLCRAGHRQHRLPSRRLRDPLAWRFGTAHGACLLHPHLPRHGGPGGCADVHVGDGSSLRLA